MRRDKKINRPMTNAKTTPVMRRSLIRRHAVVEYLMHFVETLFARPAGDRRRSAGLSNDAENRRVSEGVGWKTGGLQTLYAVFPVD
jgi:hypothetical protein